MGYYELYIPVWDPEVESQPVNLTIDIEDDEETLDEIHSQLHDRISAYGPADSDEMGHIEEFVGGHLNGLLDHGLITETYCDEFSISSVEDLEERLDDDDFGVFPL